MGRDYKDSLNFLANDTIGIIGCGHLGRAIAEKLIDRGFPKERLVISHGGSVSTHESIKRAGLLDNLLDNEEICDRSGTVFIAVRPQAFGGLKGLSFPEDTLVVSCMAGVPLASLKEAMGIDAIRIMPSGPDTIKKGKGIVAVYPENRAVIDMLSGMGLKVYVLPKEDLMHIFTVGVCLPAALLVAENKELDIFQGVDAIKEEYSDFGEIYAWAEGVLPEFDLDDRREEYVKRMSTKGGITEAIVDRLNSGGSFQDALRIGIARSKEISAKASWTYLRSL